MCGIDVLKELQKQELQNVPKIVILDVCRNSPFIGVGWRITAQSLEQVRLSANCKLVFSSTAGELLKTDAASTVLSLNPLCAVSFRCRS